MSANTTEAVGCSECKRRVYSGTWPPPGRIAVHPDGPTFLHRCEICQTYWHFTNRLAMPISDNRARELYPSAFAQGAEKE